MLRANANAGFTDEEATDPFLCGRKRGVRVAEVSGIPEVDTRLVGHFDGDAKIVERRLGESLSLCFRGLAEI